MIGWLRFDDTVYADGTSHPGTFNAEFDDAFAFGADAGFDAFLGKGAGGSPEASNTSRSRRNPSTSR